MAVPRMPQWMTCGDGVPVGALSETVSVAVTTVVGNSDGVTLAVAIGGSVVTMTSVCEVEKEVDVATSIGGSVVSMTSDVVVVVVEETSGTRTDVTVGSSVDVSTSAVVEEAGMGRMLISGVEVMLAVMVRFPGMSTEEVGTGVGVTYGVLMLGNDVKLEGPTKVGPGTKVVFTEVVRL